MPPSTRTVSRVRMTEHPWPVPTTHGMSSSRATTAVWLFTTLRRPASAPIASTRLRKLVENGVLRQEPYRNEGQRTRQRYLLTPKGTDLSTVLLALGQWSFHRLGDQSAMATPHDCGATVRARLVCDHGHEVSPEETDLRVRAHRPADTD